MSNDPNAAMNRLSEHETYRDHGPVPDTVMANLMSLNQEHEMLDGAISQLTERLGPGLGEETPAPDSAGNQLAAAPVMRSELVTRTRDLCDNARRLRLRIERLTERVEL